MSVRLKLLCVVLGVLCHGSVIQSHAQQLVVRAELADGSRWTGAIVEGKPNGHGTKDLSSGYTYIGNVKDGVPHGQGSLLGPAGNVVLSGIWENGRLNGQYYSQVRAAISRPPPSNSQVPPSSTPTRATSQPAIAFGVEVAGPQRRWQWWSDTRGVQFGIDVSSYHLANGLASFTVVEIRNDRSFLNSGHQIDCQRNTFRVSESILYNKDAIQMPLDDVNYLRRGWQNIPPTSIASNLKDFVCDPRNSSRR